MSPAARGTQRFCPNCGAKVTKTQKFCPECGNELQAAAADTEKLAPAPRSRGRATAPLPPPAAPAAPPMPPPSVSPGRLPPPPAPPQEAAPSWPAWAGAGACGVLVIASGLPWISAPGFSADGFDVPLAILFSDTATGGLPLGWVFLLAAAAGLGMALLNPDNRPLSIALMSAGGASTFFALWYMIKALSLPSAPGSTALAIGALLAILASLGILAGGIWLRLAPGRATVPGR